MQEDTLTASDAEYMDSFGWSVSIDGAVALVGARGWFASPLDFSGSAYFFRHNGNTWVEEAIVADPGGGVDDFGESVNVNGDLAIIGAPRTVYMGGHSGLAYVYRYEGQPPVWALEQTLIPAGAATDDRVGHSVAIASDVAVVGAPGDDDNGFNSGSAFVFRFSGSAWMQEADFHGDYSEEFGHSVAMTDDAFVAGRQDAPEVSSFTFGGAGWSAGPVLAMIVKEQFSGFGWCVAMDGENVLVGAPNALVQGTDAGAGAPFSHVADCNGNGLPDACEPDCNANGIPDDCDIFSGMSEDCNNNGIPDECDIVTTVDVIFVFDASGSISLEVFSQQTDGIADFICAPETIVPRDGTVGVGAIEFALQMPEDQHILNRTVLVDDWAAEAVCSWLSTRYPISGPTYLAPALDEAISIFQSNPYPGERRLYISTDAGVDDGAETIDRCDTLRSMSPPVTICTALVGYSCPNENQFLRQLANLPDAPGHDPTQPIGTYTCVGLPPGFAYEPCPECLPTATVDDCNDNGIPDECDCDRDGNGTPDDCEPGWTCAEDVNRDNVIDVLDLLLVLAAWGATSGMEDINCDEIVNVLDLLAVLAAWGTCAEPGSGTPPDSVMDCINMYGNDIEKMIGCIEAMLKKEGG